MAIYYPESEVTKMNWIIKHSVLGIMVAITAAASQARATFQYDLRFAPGQPGETDPHDVTLDASSPATYTLQLWGQISGDTNFNNDAWNDGFVSIESIQGTAPAFTSGGVISAQTGTHVSANNSNGKSTFTNGTSANITDDGLTDWGRGDTLAVTGTTLWRGGNAPGYIGGTPDAESEQVDANTWEVLLVTYTIAVGDQAPVGGATSFDVLATPIIRNGVIPGPPLVAYTDDPLVPSGSVTVSDNTHPFQNTAYSIIGNVNFSTFGGVPSTFTPEFITIPTTPEPTSLSLLTFASTTLLNRRRRQI